MPDSGESFGARLGVRRGSSVQDRVAGIYRRYVFPGRFAAIRFARITVRNRFHGDRSLCRLALQGDLAESAGQPAEPRSFRPVPFNSRVVPRSLIFTAANPRSELMDGFS